MIGCPPNPGSVMGSAGREELPNLRRERFVTAYLGEAQGSGTAAARIAGYAGSDATLAVTAHRLLSLPYIRNRVRAELERSAMSASEVLGHLTAIAREPGTATRDRIRALEILAKHHGLLAERVDVLMLDSLIESELIRIRG